MPDHIVAGTEWGKFVFRHLGYVLNFRITFGIELASKIILYDTKCEMCLKKPNSEWLSFALNPASKD